MALPKANVTLPFVDLSGGKVILYWMFQKNKDINALRY